MIVHMVQWLIDYEYGKHRVYNYNTDKKLYHYDKTPTCIHMNKYFNSATRTFIIKYDCFVTMFSLKIWAQNDISFQNFTINVNNKDVWQSNIGSVGCITDKTDALYRPNWQSYDGLDKFADDVKCFIDVVLCL